MAYASSSSVIVFPAALRTYIPTGNVQTAAKFTTENNISGIVRSVTDSESYLISPRESSASINSLEFIIHGYYFKVDATDSNISSLLSGDLWAGIELDSSSRLKSMGSTTELDSTNFYGLVFAASESGLDLSGDYYSLQLLESGAPCEASLYKIDASSLSYINGDSETVSIESMLDDLDDNLDTIENRFTNGVLNVANGGTGVSDSTTSAAITAANADVATKLGTVDVGSSIKPIYLSSGTATASSSTVGSTNQLIYLNSGELTSGISIVGSTSAPSSSDSYANGSVWVVYSN